MRPTWGPFIKAIQYMADEDPFWSESGLFSANDHRRMLDHEYLSELAIAYLHGPQNKKDRLDYYYQLYEERFEDREHVVKTFRKVTAEIEQLITRLAATRWKKKSDFYTLFLALAPKEGEFPWWMICSDWSRRSGRPKIRMWWPMPEMSPVRRRTVQIV